MLAGTVASAKSSWVGWDAYDTPEVEEEEEPEGRKREERRVSGMMGGCVVTEEIAPQILTKTPRPMKA